MGPVLAHRVLVPTGLNAVMCSRCQHLERVDDRCGKLGLLGEIAEQDVDGVGFAGSHSSHVATVDAANGGRCVFSAASARPAEFGALFGEVLAQDGALGTPAEKAQAGIERSEDVPRQGLRVPISDGGSQMLGHPDA